MLVTILLVVLVLWLIGAFAPINSGRAYIGGGPYLGGGVGLMLLILLLLVLFGHGSFGAL